MSSTAILQDFHAVFSTDSVFTVERVLGATQSHDNDGAEAAFETFRAYPPAALLLTLAVGLDPVAPAVVQEGHWNKG